jgi:PAS domain S-box-containing protein
MTNTIPVALFVEQDTQCTYANRAAERLTGYSHQELLRISFCQLILSNPSNELAKQLTESLKGTEPATFCGAALILTKKGQKRWLDIIVASFPVKARFAALITAFDMTDRRWREDGIRHLVE